MKEHGAKHTSVKSYSPDKINVNPDFIKSNYLTASSNKNVKITIVKICDGEQVIHHQSSR
jgi:hypothetical protein